MRFKHNEVNFEVTCESYWIAWKHNSWKFWVATRNFKTDLIMSDPNHVKFFFINLLHSQAAQIFDLAKEKYINMSKISILILGGLIN